MALRQRGNSWQIDVTVARIRYREDWPTEEAAIRREAEIRANAVAGKDITPKDRTDTAITLATLQERTFDRVWKDAKSANNLNKVSKEVVKFFGPNKLITEINTVSVDEMVDGLKKARNANATINRKLAALSRMLRFAQERGWVRDLPQMKRLKEPTGRTRYFTDEEEARILATLRVWGKDDAADLVAFLIDTGARVSEALKLQWQDVNAGKALFVDTKNGRSRAVPLFQRSREILAKRKGKARPFGLKYTEINKLWDRMRGHLGYADDPQFIIHTLRHTRASRFAMEGWSAPRIKEFMGHRNLRTTERYMHLSPTDLDQMVEPRQVTVRHLMAVKENQG